jgi:peptidyl-prolyl cis-trans isomerase C
MTRPRPGPLPRLVRLLGACGILLCAACTRDDAAATAHTAGGEWLARVNGTPIGKADVEELLGENPAVAEPEEARQLALDELIERELLHQYAVREHLERDDRVRAAIEKSRQLILSDAGRQRLLEKAAPITDEELRRRYQQEVAQAEKTEYAASHIVVESEAQAREIIRRLDKGQRFEAVANEFSSGPSGAEGGDLGWVPPGSVTQEFYVAMKGLQKGEYTRVPVRTAYGWHVIRINDVRPFVPPPFEQVREELRQLAQNTRVADALAQLRAQAKIELPGADPASR